MKDPKEPPEEDRTPYQQGLPFDGSPEDGEDETEFIYDPREADE
jgi:hypothetical protein